MRPCLRESSRCTCVQPRWIPARQPCPGHLLARSLCLGPQPGIDVTTAGACYATTAQDLPSPSRSDPRLSHQLVNSSLSICPSPLRSSKRIAASDWTADSVQPRDLQSCWSSSVDWAWQQRGNHNDGQSVAPQPHVWCKTRDDAHLSMWPLPSRSYLSNAVSTATITAPEFELAIVTIGESDMGWIWGIRGQQHEARCIGTCALTSSNRGRKTWHCGPISSMILAKLTSVCQGHLLINAGHR